MTQEQIRDEIVKWQEANSDERSALLFLVDSRDSSVVLKGDHERITTSITLAMEEVPEIKKCVFLSIAGLKPQMCCPNGQPGPDPIRPFPGTPAAIETDEEKGGVQ